MESIIKWSKKNIICLLLLLIAVVISLSLKTNAWNKEVIGVDSSVFVSIAEKIHDGKVPYRDVFDHKGPILYFINYLGTIHDSYIVLYIIELILIFIDVFLLYKIASRILGGNSKSIIAMLITVLTLPIVLQGGNFAEEYALPFILWSLYVFLKPIKNKKDYFITGLCFGIVALLKINMIQVWVIGYILVVIEAFRNKSLKTFLDAFINSILGFIAIIIPVVIYLIANGAFNDFIYQYIIFNMKYSVLNSTSLLVFIKQSIQMYFFTYCIVLINIWQIIKYRKNSEDRKVLITALIFSLFTMIMLIMTKNVYEHYIVGMLPCYIIPISYMLKSFDNIEKNKWKVVIIVLLIVIFISSTSQLYADANYNGEYYKIIDRLKQIANEEDDVLVLGNGLMINVLSNTSTNCKYIYQYPIEYVDENIRNEVIDYIVQGKPDVIVFAYSSDEINRALSRAVHTGVYRIDDINNRIVIRNGEV